MRRQVPPVIDGVSVPTTVGSPATASRGGASHSKYGAVKTVVDGITFASKAEARRYQELKLLERAGEISRLELQPRYDITINGIYCGHYKADFRFFTKTGVRLEDVKGHPTPLYKFKKRCVEALYPGVKITEVK